MAAANKKPLIITFIVISVVSLWIIAVYLYLYYYVFKLDEAPVCESKVIDKVTVLDDKTIDGDKFHALYRLSGSGDEFIELYDQTIIIDRCAKANVDPVYSVAVKPNKNSDSAQLCAYGLKVDAKTVEVLYTEDNTKCKLINELKIIDD